MLNLFTGLLREAMGINSEERRVAERAQLRRELEKESRTLITSVTQTRDPRRVLVEHWLWLSTSQRELDASAGSRGIELEGRLAMKMIARWQVIAAPLFDVLPLLAARLSCVDTLDGATAWIGSGQQMLRASDGACRRGLRISVDLEQRVTRLHRGAALVATLVEDPAHTADHVHHAVSPGLEDRRELVEALQRGLVAGVTAIPDA